MQLLHGDCLELMKGIPDKSVDMILCDLPYGTTQNKWDSVIPFEPLWEQYHRICKKNAAICLFGQTPFSATLVMSNLKEFRYEWIWQKPNATGFLNSKKMPLRAHESVSVFYAFLPTYNPQMEDGHPYKKGSHPGSTTYREGIARKGERQYSGKRFPKDVIKFSNCNRTKGRNYHPTQKPVALLKYLIRTYTNDGETVLDNCMGSGSTGVACVQTGRDFIGIELDDNYFEIAQKRIYEAQEALDGKA